MRIRQWSVWVPALFVVWLGSGCQSQTTTPSQSTVEGQATSQAPAGTEVAKRDNALVRIVNAGNDQVDVYFGDTKAFVEVAGEKVTPYTEIPAQRQDLKLVAAGKDPKIAPLATNNEGFSEGGHYTVVAFKKEDGSSGITMFQDDLTTPSVGKARIRVINVATGVDEFDVYPAGKDSTLVKGVNFNSATSYKEVDPSMKTIEIRRKGAKQVAASVPDLSLSAGKTYTILVLKDANELKVIPVEDHLAG